MNTLSPCKHLCPKQFGVIFLALSATAMLPALASQEFTFDVTTKTTTPQGFTDPTGTHKAGEVDVKDEKMTLKLTPTWCSYGTSDSFSIYDGAHKKIILVDAKKRSYESIDTHAYVDFCVAESQNRKMLGKLMSSAKVVKPEPNTEFDVESFFSVVIPGSTEGPAKQQKNGDAIQFLHNSKVVCSVVPSTYTIDSANAESYKRFLAFCTHLHPTIATALAQDKTIFSTLHSDGMGSFGFGEKQTVDMKLVNTNNSGSDEMPSIEGYSFERDPMLVPVHDAFAKLGPNPKLPTKDEVTDAIHTAMREGQPLDAFLTICEQTWMTTDDMTDEIRRLKMSVMMDPNCRTFTMALSQPNKEQMKEVEQALGTIDRSKLKHAEAIDIVLANDLTGIGEYKRAETLMIGAITKNPRLVGAYLDLMQIMNAQYHTSAWDCVEIARKLNPNYPRVKDIDDAEHRLEKDFPMFF
jgi:hypothetical protein